LYDHYRNAPPIETTRAKKGHVIIAERLLSGVPPLAHSGAGWTRKRVTTCNYNQRQGLKFAFVRRSPRTHETSRQYESRRFDSWLPHVAATLHPIFESSCRPLIWLVRVFPSKNQNWSFGWHFPSARYVFT
jgi:hypothetical protein